VFWSLYQAHAFHGDPHPGNYDTVREPRPRTMTRKYTSAVARPHRRPAQPAGCLPGQGINERPRLRVSRISIARCADPGPLLRVCPGLSRNSQSTPPRERAPPIKVPRAPDLRPGGTAGWVRPVEPAACIYPGRW
jgi:hypothetical protein